MTERDIALAAARALSRRGAFSDRGLSGRTIDALLEVGVDAPERLLFLPESELRKLKVGPGGYNEILRYRERFLPKA
jgi:hypothetical protein